MSELIKIKNITKEQVKISVCVKSNIAPGVILKAGQFCIAKNQKTAPLDKQLRSKRISIEDFENNYSLELAKAYDESFLDKAKENTKNYAK
jgi:hypothetical protein